VNRLGDIEREAIDESSDIVYDVSDTMFSGNPAYGPVILIPHYLRNGEVHKALGLAKKALKLYLMNHARAISNGQDESNIQTIDEEYQYLDELGTEKGLLERCIDWYVNNPLFQRKGLDECNEEFRKRGKRLGAITFESSETADATKKRHKLDYVISNVTKYFPTGTVNGIDFKMRTPNDRPRALEEKIGPDRMKKAVLITNNKTDWKAFEGKVGIVIPFSKSRKGEFCIDNYKKFLKQLQDAD
jgi:hypothetical protein